MDVGKHPLSKDWAWVLDAPFQHHGGGGRVPATLGETRVAPGQCPLVEPDGEGRNALKSSQMQLSASENR